MQEVYESTALTPIRVAKSSGFIDWTSQPSLFKHYPNFLFRYSFGGNIALKMIELSRVITSRSMIGGNPYYRLNIPSAGNLHPVELYVQIRGIKGVLSGIYHVDAGADSLVLIREIDRDGLEPVLGMQKRFNGMIFILSSVPFRSEWKYGKRAIRYAYLDIGHQVGAIQAATTICQQKTTILSSVDVNRLNTLMGFKEDEFISALIAVGDNGDTLAEELKSPLMYVSPTDYNETKGYLSSIIKEQKAYDNLIPIYFALNEEFDESVIRERRSARQFGGSMIPKAAFDVFIHLLSQLPHAVSCSMVVLQEGVIQEGIYKNAILIKEGKYGDELSGLLVDQSFIKKASFVIIFTSEQFGSDTLISAGAFAQQLQLYAQKMDIGFTGIGAFYDAKLQNFLKTQEYILYVCAVGTHKK